MSGQADTDFRVRSGSSVIPFAFVCILSGELTLSLAWFRLIFVAVDRSLPELCTRGRLAALRQRECRFLYANWVSQQGTCAMIFLDSMSFV
jgi:hypothetical protein